jgi:predicted RecA/RadA family phage recombinase
VATNYIQPGNVLTIPAPVTVASGGVVTVGEIAGVAMIDAAQGEPVSVETTGVYRLPKVAANSIGLGAPVYWNADDALATSTATGNARLGVAVEAAPAATGEVTVRLSGF